MILRFPSLSALEFALRSGVVPARIVEGGGDATTTPDGEIHLKSKGRSSAALRKSLQQIGGDLLPGDELPPGDRRRVCSWAELIPLDPCADELQSVTQDRLLFECRTWPTLEKLVTEFLRLGFDRIEIGSIVAANDAFVLIMTAPPLYPVLKAIDGGFGEPVRCFQEQAAGVWIERGWQHRLSERFRGSDSHWLFISRDSPWQFVTEPKLQPVDHLLDVQLPAVADQSLFVTPLRRIPVPLELRPHQGEALPDFWTIPESGVAEWDRFVANAESELLKKLRFAVIESEGVRCVLVARRPGSQSHTAFRFSGREFHKAAGVDWLFVPLGKRLHPPLRPDWLRQLFFKDDESFVWLEPVEESKFRVRTIAEEKFHPVSEWVDYLFDQESVALTAWVNSLSFDFEEFEVVDLPLFGSVIDPAVPRRRDETLLEAEPLPGYVIEASSTADPSEPLNAQSPEPAEAPGSTDDLNLPTESSSALATGDSSESRQLRVIQQRFLELKGPFDSPERSGLWEEIGRLRGTVNVDPEDVVYAWLNVLWNRSAPESVAIEQLERVDESFGQESAERPEALDSEPNPEPVNPRGPSLRIAVDVVTQRSLEGNSAAEIVNAVRNELRAAEPVLSVQAAWLAWTTLCERTSDLLDLAKAKDRLLDRLEHEGLNVTRDLPRFLRPKMQRSGRGAIQFEERLSRVRQAASSWIAKEFQGRPSSSTDAIAVATAYSELIFHVVMAVRVDRPFLDSDWETISRPLQDIDLVHDWLRDGFWHRIRSARWPGKFSQEAKELQRRLSGESILRATYGPHRLKATFLIDQFRRQISILESEREEGLRREVPPADRAIQELVRWLESPGIEGKDISLATCEPFQRLAIETVALPNRLAAHEAVLRNRGERAAAVMPEALALTSTLAMSIADPAAELRLIEAALDAAGRFDLQHEVPFWVQRLASSFSQFLNRKQNPQDLEPVVRILEKAAVRLRRIGLPERTRELVYSAREAIERRSTPERRSSVGLATPLDEPASNEERDSSRLTLILSLAPAVVDLDGTEAVAPWLDEALHLLESADSGTGGSFRPIYRQALARAVCRASGCLPEELSLARLADLFDSLKGIGRSTSVDSHFPLPILSVIDAAAVALTRADFDVDPTLRQLLNDAEFVIRRRIHEDYRQAAARWA